MGLAATGRSPCEQFRESRVQRLEAKAGTEEGPIVIVFEAADGGWTTQDGERVARAELPANAQVIVFRLYNGGPE